MCKSKWLPLILDGRISEQRGSAAAAKAGRDITTQEEIKNRVQVLTFTLALSASLYPPAGGVESQQTKSHQPHPPQSEFGIRSKTLSAAAAGKRARCQEAIKSSVNDTVSGRLGSASRREGEQNKYEDGLRLGRGGTLCWEVGGDFF